MEGRKEGVQGREGDGAVDSRGDGKVSELPCLLRGRSRKTTEFSGAAAVVVVVVVQFLFWPPEDGGDQGRWQSQWGRGPRVTERHRYTHTPEDFVSITYTTAKANEDFHSSGGLEV